jgi:hypothetical protein
MIDDSISSSETSVSMYGTILDINVAASEDNVSCLEMPK